MAQIIPFRINISDADLDDLRSRLARAGGRRRGADDWSQGIPLNYTRELAEYWAHEYDWRS